MTLTSRAALIAALFASLNIDLSKTASQERKK